MYIILWILCGLESIHDIKTKTISPIIWLLVSIGCIIWNVTQNEKDWLWICMAAFVGIFLMICSKVLKGGIGVGDGIVFLTLGLGLGIKEASNILFCSLILCWIWGSVQLLRKRCSRTDELPFLPFVFVGMIWNQIMRCI